MVWDARNNAKIAPRLEARAEIVALKSEGNAATLQAYLHVADNPPNGLDPAGRSWWNTGTWSSSTWQVIGAVGLGIGMVAPAAAGVGLLADEGLLATYVGVEAAETISSVAAYTAVIGAAAGLGLDGLACFGHNDQGACVAMIFNAVGAGMGAAGTAAGED